MSAVVWLNEQSARLSIYTEMRMLLIDRKLARVAAKLAETGLS